MDKRTRKRLETRQKISDIATSLFIEKGFENVTVDEIANTADVGRMTVFNHFPRKEDMFFDLDEDFKDDLLIVLKSDDFAKNPINAIRDFLTRSIQDRRPYLRFLEGSVAFNKTVRESVALINRARDIKYEYIQLIANMLNEHCEFIKHPAHSHFLSNLICSTCESAFIQAHDVFAKENDEKKAHDMLTEILDLGFEAQATAQNVLQSENTGSDAISN